MSVSTYPICTAMSVSTYPICAAMSVFTSAPLAARCLFPSNPLAPHRLFPPASFAPQSPLTAKVSTVQKSHRGRPQHLRRIPDFSKTNPFQLVSMTRRQTVRFRGGGIQFQILHRRPNYTTTSRVFLLGGKVIREPAIHEGP